MIENDLAWVHDKRAVLTKDRLRWLEIMEVMHNTFKASVDNFTRHQLKEMIKFCGEQSVEIKKQLSKIK
jgi:hypothetical protein